MRTLLRIAALLALLMTATICCATPTASATIKRDSGCPSGTWVEASDVCAGESVKFTAAYAGAYATYKWDFNMSDGAQYTDRTGQIVYWTFTSGPHTVGLKVTESNDGGINTWVASVYAGGIVTDVVANTSHACIDESVVFTATTSPAGHYDAICWSGGGTPATQSGGRTFSTSWSTTGTKTVTATSCGGGNNASVEIVSDDEDSEVGAVDGTPSLDAAEVYGDLTSTPHSFTGTGLYDLNNNKSDGTGEMCVDLGAESDFLNVSGHGAIGTAEAYGVSGYGLFTDTFIPEDIGSDWDCGELEWLLMAVCSQVSVSSTPADSDTGILWIEEMPDVHCLMGYRSTAPTDGADVTIANKFLLNAQTQKVHMAWMNANRPSSTVCPGRFATCLVNENNVDDELDSPTSDDRGSTYRYYYIERHGIPYFYTYTIENDTITLP